MLSDSYSRRFGYLRLSVTNACNFKCAYCLPNGYQCTSRNRLLTVSEIQNLVDAFVSLGLKKIRLTGGEPTLRQDIVDIVRSIKQTHPQLDIALTTNAYRLVTLLPKLKDAGIDAINISLDSLKKDNFLKICGVDECDNVKSAIELATSMGIKTKVNAVLLKDLNDHELGDFMQWIKTRNISLRFIELMRTNDNRDYFLKHHISAKEISEALKDNGWQALDRKTTDGPALELSHPQFKGRLGFIAPYSKDFCKSCNRLRVSAAGGLRLCLFGEGTVNLRPFLESPEQKTQLITTIKTALLQKPEAHRLNDNFSGDMNSLSAIGG